MIELQGYIQYIGAAPKGRTSAEVAVFGCLGVLPFSVSSVGAFRLTQQREREVRGGEKARKGKAGGERHGGRGNKGGEVKGKSVSSLVRILSKK